MRYFLIQLVLQTKDARFIKVPEHIIAVDAESEAEHKLITEYVEQLQAGTSPNDPTPGLANALSIGRSWYQAIPMELVTLTQPAEDGGDDDEQLPF